MIEALVGSATRLLADPAEGAGLDGRTLAWLRHQGVPLDAITSPIAVRVARVVFDPDDRYRPCTYVGAFALVIPVPADPAEIVTDLGAIDLGAWAPKSGRIATRLGEVFALGAEQVGVDGLGTTGLPLPVHRDPLGWLRAGRRRIVIADWDLAAFALRGLLLEAEDDAHRRDLIRRLTPLPPTVVVSGRRAAA